MRSSLGVALLLFLIPEVKAQDQSTIYFYRPAKTDKIGFEITDGSKSICLMRPGTVFVYQCDAGPHEFVGTGTTRSSFRMDTEPGKEYFIRCGVSTDSSRRATFRLARKGESRVEIKKIDEVTASKISQTVLVTSPDTIKAMRHLFKRKHGWGVAWTILGNMAIVGNGASLIAYEPPKVDIGYGQTIETDNRASLVLGLLVGFTWEAMGVTRLSYYKTGRLDAMLEDRAFGAPFPEKVMKHLKPRDFLAK